MKKTKVVNTGPPDIAPVENRHRSVSCASWHFSIRLLKEDLDVVKAKKAIFALNFLAD